MACRGCPGGEKANFGALNPSAAGCFRGVDSTTVGAVNENSPSLSSTAGAPWLGVSHGKSVRGGGSSKRTGGEVWWLESRIAEPGVRAKVRVSSGRDFLGDGGSMLAAVSAGIAWSRASWRPERCETKRKHIERSYQKQAMDYTGGANVTMHLKWLGYLAEGLENAFCDSIARTRVRAQRRARPRDWRPHRARAAVRCPTIDCRLMAAGRYC